MTKGYNADEDPQGTVEDFPVGSNLSVAHEFKRVTRGVRGEDEGRKGSHMCEYLLGTSMATQNFSILATPRRYRTKRCFCKCCHSSTPTPTTKEKVQRPRSSIGVLSVQNQHSCLPI